MNLADKIITLRKKNGWSQEELADKLDVSRQSVSKWEGAQSVPDLNKIILLSQIFGVSTDYLLKDGDEPAFTPVDEKKKRLVTRNDAGRFLALRREAAKTIAIGTTLCILSPIPMFLLLAFAGALSMTEDMASVIGAAIVILLAAPACYLFITCGLKNKPFEFLNTEEFDTEMGVQEMVRRTQEEFLPTYSKYNALAAVLCILSAIPVTLAGMSQNETLIMLSLCLLMVMVSVGVWFFVRNGVIYASTQKLLQEGEYTPLNKKINEKAETIHGIYWLITTAVYLGWSFITNDWHISWIIWPVAGVLFAAFSIALRQYLKKKYE